MYKLYQLMGVHFLEYRCIQERSFLYLAIVGYVCSGSRVAFMYSTSKYSLEAI